MLADIVSNFYVARFYKDLNTYVKFESPEEQRIIDEMTARKIASHFYDNDEKRLLHRTVLLLQANPTDASKWSTYVKKKFVEALDKCLYHTDEEAVMAFKTAST